MTSWRGFTIQVYVDDMSKARPWYEKLLGRNPDFAANPEFLEWEIVPDLWFQVVKKEKPPEDAARKRLGVSNIQKERQRIIGEMGIDVSEIEELPKGVVRWCNFQDHGGISSASFKILRNILPPNHEDKS